jgi:hypothetical protein
MRRDVVGHVTPMADTNPAPDDAASPAPDDLPPPPEQVVIEPPTDPVEGRDPATLPLDDSAPGG